MPEERESKRPDWAAEERRTAEERGVAVETIQPRELSLMESGGFAINRLEDAWKLAEATVRGGMAPKGMTAGSVVAVWQAGAELKITPMRSLQMLTHIHGRLGMMCEELLAQCRKAGAFAKGGRPKLYWVLDGQNVQIRDFEAMPIADWPDGLTACAFAKPADDPEETLERSFSVLEARRARLWEKRGSAGDSAWVTYPARMLRARAMAFLLRDEFSEFLGAAGVTEELRDVETQGARDVTPTGEPQLDTSGDPHADIKRMEEETDDALFDAAVKKGEEIEDAQVVSGEEPASAADNEPLAQEPAPAVGSPPASERKLTPLTCVNCGARDEYPREGPFTCTNSEPGNIHDVRVKKFATGPAVPPAAKPKETAKKKTTIDRRELVTMLACGDHPIRLEVVQKWELDQLHAARAWIQEEIVAMDALEEGVDYERRPIPRPSFIPEYGEPSERLRLNFPDPGMPAPAVAEEREEVQQPLIHPFPDNPCMFAYEDGGACGLEAGHGGDHEPL